jgi:hypothetical protein
MFTFTSYNDESIIAGYNDPGKSPSDTSAADSGLYYFDLNSLRSTTPPAQD